jgi:hypothetical protein
MKHVLIVYGKPKGHGKARKNVPEYIGPVPPKAVYNVNKWFVEQFKGLGPTPEEIK